MPRCTEGALPCLSPQAFAIGSACKPLFATSRVVFVFALLCVALCVCVRLFPVHTCCVRGSVFHVLRTSFFAAGSEVVGCESHSSAMGKMGFSSCDFAGRAASTLAVVLSLFGLLSGSVWREAIEVACLRGCFVA
eukprot:RCo020867